MIKRLVKEFGNENSNLDKLPVLIMCQLWFSGFLSIDKLFPVKLKEIQIKETQLLSQLLWLDPKQSRRGRPDYDENLVKDYNVAQLCTMHLEKTIERLI